MACSDARHTEMKDFQVTSSEPGIIFMHPTLKCSSAIFYDKDQQEILNMPIEPFGRWTLLDPSYVGV